MENPSQPIACPRCRRALPDLPEAKYCPYCGRKTAQTPAGALSAGSKRVLLLLLGLFLLSGTAVGVLYKQRIVRYVQAKVRRVPPKPRPVPASERRKIASVLERYKGKAFGIDVSSYQEGVDWRKVDSLAGERLRFAFVRATAGSGKRDGRFSHHWKGAKKRGLARGAYHYYRPNENSLEQAENFIGQVELEKGDLPPVLDIEALPRSGGQSVASLRTGLLKWLEAVEAHYGAVPIIYTGQHFYQTHLQPDRRFRKYPLWVANYNAVDAPSPEGWAIWQFSMKGRISGVPGDVDLNVWNGGEEALEALRIR